MSGFVRRCRSPETASPRRAVVHVDGDLQRELRSLDGVAGFNDATTDSAGRVLAGALRFQPFAGEDPVPTEVWRISAPGIAEVAAEGIDWPNGIAATPDDRALYVSDTANGVIRVFEGGRTEGDVFITTADNPTDPEKGGTVFHARAEVAGAAVNAATV